MEIHIVAWGEDPIQKHKYKSNEAYITFVSIDGAGIPKVVNELLPETDEEKKLYDAAKKIYNDLQEICGDQIADMPCSD